LTAYKPEPRPDCEYCYINQGNWNNQTRKSNCRPFSDGSVYTGGFLDGAASGTGIYTDISRWSYEGGFLQGLFEGEGTLTFANGEELTGEWSAGRLIA